MGACQCACFCVTVQCVYTGVLVQKRGTHKNANHLRIVWSRIWSLLADFFIEVGCHKNLQVAMYAVDSLRQLSMKFLERDELTNFTFQNDFLRPFVFVMRQSKSVEIRELIIRCDCCQ